MNDDKKAGISRADIETLCILDAIGAGCPPGDLAERLGLSRSLADAVAVGAWPLTVQGWVALDDDQFTVTAEGRAMMTSRLQELGLA